MLTKLHAFFSDSTASFVDDEKWVVVKNDVCEGFFEEGKERTQAYEESAGSSTINEFLNSKTDLRTKEIKKGWFMGIHEYVVKSGVVARMRSEDLKKCFVEQIARIWFDFDNLHTARLRKFKSWSRVEKVVEESTKVLVEQTEMFLEKEEARAGKDKSGQKTRYVQLLRQLNF